MSLVSLDRTVARLRRSFRSRSNLRPFALWCLGAATALLGIALGLSNLASSAFAASLIMVGIVLGAFAVAAIMLRPNAANDN